MCREGVVGTKESLVPLVNSQKTSSKGKVPIRRLICFGSRSNNPLNNLNERVFPDPFGPSRNRTDKFGSNGMSTEKSPPIMHTDFNMVWDGERSWISI